MTPCGFLAVDKPRGITSRRAVDVVQTWLPPGTKVGHAGTLDPLATGVLVVGVGKGTRLVDRIQRMEKEYEAGVVFGATSTTDDAEGTLTPSGGAVPTRDQIEAALPQFLGTIEQRPPAFSAAKVAGRRAYALARRGQEVDLAPRRVEVHAIRVLAYEPPRLRMVVRCGKGTYIRSLARDLGQALGCGGYIDQLRRTRIGPFASGLSLETEPSSALAQLQPMEIAVGDLPRVVLADDDLKRFCRGGGAAAPAHVLGATGEVAVFDADLRLRGLASVAEGRLLPTKVFGEID